MLEYAGFLIFGFAMLLLARYADKADTRWWRDALLFVLAVCVLGGILWEYIHRGFVLPFTW